MTLEFLGTGTSAGVPMIGCNCATCASDDPRDKRLRTSAIVRLHGRTLLIDAGPDLRQQLLRAGVLDVDGVLLTHSHMDHIAGIDELRVFNFRHGRPVTLYGDAATLGAVRRMYGYAFADSAEKYPGVPELVLQEVSMGSFTVAGFPILPIRVEHYRMPVLGFRIGGLTYITDAKSIDPAEREKIGGSEVLVLNALRQEPHISHLTLQEALALVKELQPTRTFFTHISHQLGRHAEVEPYLPAGVKLAHDGLVVELADP